mgnify:CR=1 FL=1|tara:strand:- start:860 stop:1660 length:801 start_codon:yes stop_codon:yes gene_type:complete
MTSAIVNILAATNIISRQAQIDHVVSFQETGAQKHIDALVHANLPAAVKIAKRFRRNGIELVDLVAEAVTGIIRAAQSFEPSAGASFNTYASTWMRARVQEFVQANCGTLRVGTRAGHKLHNGLAKVRREHGSDVSFEVIAAELDIEVSEVEAILPLITTRAASLSTPIGDGEISLGDTINSDLPDAEELVNRSQFATQIREVLADFAQNLKPLQKDVLERRVIADLMGNSKADANTFGVTKQRVSQIERDLLKRLRARMTKAGLR